MNFKDLHAGDIILFKLNGTLFHAAIYAPYDDRTTNIIDVTSTKGCARGTLEGLFKNLSAGVTVGNVGCFFSNRLTVHIVRHRYLKGIDIAEQAEFWRLTKVTYGIHTLLELTEASRTKAKKINKETNLEAYCHYAKRANAPMIDDPIAPSRLVIFLSVLIAPLLNLPTMCVSFVMKFIRYLQPERNPGTTCGGFVLSVLGAVALKNADYSDISDCSKKLGSLIMVHPDEFHPEVVEKVLSDTETFMQLGQLNTMQLSSEKFNRETFHQERKADLHAMASIRAMCQL